MKSSPASLAKAFQLFEANQLPAALREVRAFLQTRPNNFEALQLCGAICSDLGRHDDALLNLRRAADLNPTSAPIHHNLGNALMAVGEIPEALRSFATGLKFGPREPLLLCASANALAELKRYDEALAQFRMAIAIEPKFADAYYGLGRALMILEDYPAAKAAFDRAVQLDPADKKAALNAFHCAMEISDWDNFDKRAHISRLTALEGSNETPFRSLQLFDEPDIHLRAAKSGLALRLSMHGHPKPPASRSSQSRGRIRVGYFSADFRSHPTSRLLVGVIEQHNRENFEVIGISVGGRPDPSSAIGNRIRAAFDTFVDMGDATSVAIRDAALGLDIDIAIDLMGHTKYARPELFSPRLAPVQINYLGYPGTLGNSEMDYIVLDPFIAETGDSQHLTERPIILPDCYQPNDDRRPKPATTRSREEYGLPDDAFVFCCFNEPRKILPAIFDSWMRILKATEKSVLWLYAPNEPAKGNLRAEAGKRGVDPSRVVFCDQVSHAEHLARYGAADLFLDTYPYSAHTTASDALWCGCPVLTRVGKSFASRVAGSILTTYGLPQLITRSADEFERAACRLAGASAELRAIRYQIIPGNIASPLFDTGRYVAGFETALKAVWARRMARKNPGRIVVPSSSADEN
jgi:protein O-GlcNAc transferase